MPGSYILLQCKVSRMFAFEGVFFSLFYLSWLTFKLFCTCLACKCLQMQKKTKEEQNTDLLFDEFSVV